MTVVVTGGDGRLGRALARRGGVVAVGRAALDVTDPAAIAAGLDALAPAVVINAAAYTAVDRAETDEAAAMAVNAGGAERLARACAARGIPLVHVSTDHVFDGRAGRTYREDEPVAPVNAYGRSKAAGERAVLAAGGVVVRTSWLFGADGDGFVPRVVARAIAGEPLRVVADQHGCPTWVDHLADALLVMAARPVPAGVYHYRGDEPTTWHGFATAIVDALARAGRCAPVAVEPIATESWPAAAARPAYAVLDTGRIEALGFVPGRWRDGLAAVIRTLVGP